MRGVAGGMLSGKDWRYLEAQLTRALREGRDRKVLVGWPMAATSNSRRAKARANSASSPSRT